MSLWGPASPPLTSLGHHRQLSPLAGIHVSPLQLGAMSIGDKWAEFGMGAMDKVQSFKLLDAFYDAGRNFLDTANGYTDCLDQPGRNVGDIIGEWAGKRGIRDQLVIATKYTTNYKRGQSCIAIKANYTGNNTKSMYSSVEASLKKLRTTYIDVLYVHWWDYETSVEEVMNSLHNLVAAGEVLYLGISDSPAWVVSKANQYARDHGKTPFAIYQGAWNVMQRDFERDIIPMARSEGLALAPWNVLAAGKLRTDEEEQRRRQTGEKGRTTFDSNWERTEDEKKLSNALEKVAGEVGTKSITAVAIAYLMQKTPFVFPIIGGRKVEHLQSNIEALDISLTPEQIAYLESILPFDPGFPHNMIGNGTADVLLGSAANFDKVPLLQPILPLKK